MQQCIYTYRVSLFPEQHAFALAKGFFFWNHDSIMLSHCLMHEIL